MQDKSKKKILLELAILITLALLFGVGQLGKSEISQQEKQVNQDQQTATETMLQKTDELNVIFFNVGKADCMLIETTKGAIMIDTGYDENGEDILSWLKDEGVDTLEYLVLTHPDKDHIGGADIIMNHINVLHVIDTDCEVANKDYLQYKQVASDKGIEIETLTSTKEIVLGNAQFTLYPPISKKLKGENNYSIVTKLVYGETSFLFTGDAEKKRIDELLTQIPDLKSTVLKVPHHGNLKKNSEELFKAVAPSYSIITSDSEGDYKEVSTLLENLNSEIFVTKDGTIKVTTDGKKISISQ